MKTKINAFLKQYLSIRKRTDRLLKVVQPEHMDFSYKEGKFTVADQIRHIAAIERYMFAETLVGRKSSYNGCGKELADGYEEVLDFFDRSHQETLEIINDLQDEDLTKKCITPADAEVEKGKWLQLLAEHEIHHRGQIYLYLNMLNIETPPMYGLTSEEVANLASRDQRS